MRSTSGRKVTLSASVVQHFRPSGGRVRPHGQRAGGAAVSSVPLMRHFVTYPMVAHPYSPDLVSKQAIVRFATRAEELGFDGVGFTDHPAPSHRWLQAGGHDALDPFVAFGVVAAVTERIRLVPNILVLPYRNPFLVAKAAASLDALSDGRFVLAVATGYQRGEYRALGVDFDERNPLFDEALAVIKGIWAEDDFAYDGRHFTARGQTANPKPAHVPVWIGGNSALSRRRVAQAADGWNPFAAPAVLAKTAKTPVLETVEDLKPDARPPVAVRRRGGARPRRDRHRAAGPRLRVARAARVRPGAAPRRAGHPGRPRRDLDEHVGAGRRPRPRPRGPRAVRHDRHRRRTARLRLTRLVAPGGSSPRHRRHQVSCPGHG